MATQNLEMKTLAQNIINFRHDEVMKQLKEIENRGPKYKNQLADYRHEEKNETLLHLITKYDDDDDLVRKIISLCPSLLTEEKSDEYRGQTAFHIAVSKQNIKAVDAMLENKDTKTKLLGSCATGKRFKYTVMMGELPLSVAALTFNKDIVHLLIKNDAKISLHNKCGDTVFHSLVKYSACHPDKRQNVMDMMTFLNGYLVDRKCERKGSVEGSDEESDPVSTWFYPNYENFTPLLLASKLGQTEIFELIVNLDDVYCKFQKHDGLFDIKWYDVTEIDTVAMVRWWKKKYEENTEDMIDASRAETVNSNETRLNKLKVTEIQGVLERISELDTETAFEFVKLPVITEVIEKKWSQYRRYYYLWGLFHLIYITVITSYAIVRTEQHTYSTSGNNQTSSQTAKNFVTAVGSLNLIIPILYLIMEGKCLRERKYWNLTNIHQNGTYRFLLVLFSLSTFVDAVWYFVQPGYCHLVILSILTGSWFLTFFIRGFKQFSFFTVMMLEVVTTDAIRFFLIICFQYLSFTAVMYTLFIPNLNITEDYKSFQTTMFTLLNMMLGLSDLNILNEASVPWLATTLVVLFILLTYVLMFNALIAMMSDTCSSVSEDKITEWETQRLSVILLIENILCQSWKKCTGEEDLVKYFDIQQETVIDETRYVLELDSLRTDYTKSSTTGGGEKHEKGDKTKNKSKTTDTKVRPTSNEYIQYDVSTIYT